MRVYVLVEDLPKSRDPNNDKVKIHGVYTSEWAATRKLARVHEQLRLTKVTMYRILEFKLKGEIK